MKKLNKLTLFSSLLLASSTLVAAPLSTSTGFVYPAGKTLIDSIYMGFGDKDSNFNERCHLANDYDLPEGSPVYATTNGKVKQITTAFHGDSNSTTGTAEAMIVEHLTSSGKIFYAVYGQLQNMNVAVGDIVQQGEQLAQVGRFVSGGRSDPHLHFAINTTEPSYHSYTPTPACTDKLGFVDPEKFMLDNLAAEGSCSAVDNAVSTPENTIVNIPNVLANDTDIDGDVLTLASADSTSKNGVHITNYGDGSFSYTPIIDFKGADSFNYRVTDNTGCIKEATVFISVTESIANDDENNNNEDENNENENNTGGGGGSFNTFGIAGLLLLLFTRRFRKTLKIKQ